MDVFAFDLETFLIQPGKHVPRAVSAAWCRGREPVPGNTVELAHFNPRFGERELIFETLRDALRSADVVVGVNVPFDLAVASQEFPELWPLVWQAYRDRRILDAAITEKLIDIGKGQLGFHVLETGQVVKVKYGLADLAKRRLGIEMDKDTWRLRYGTLYEVPVSAWEDGARSYAELDATATHILCFSQSREDRRYLVDATQQARSGWWIHLMAAHGFRVDAKQVAILEETVRKELGQLSAHLLDLGLIDAKGKRNTKAAGERMIMACASQGLPVPVTPTGKIKLTEAECIETGDYTLEAYAKYTSFSNVLKKDVAALRLAADAGVPIQSTFDPLKETGRTGSSGGAKRKKGTELTAFGYQLQNVRRDFELSDGTKAPGVRECFVPRAGHLLCSIDYGQMELHAWAQVCLDILGYSDLAKMLNAGIDVHCKLGAMVIGRTYEEVYANRKKEQWAKDARQMSKPANFGYPGGLGAKTFRVFAKASYGVELDEDQAVALRNGWFAMLSEARPYLDYIARVAEIDGEIIQVRSNRVRGGIRFTDAANGFFQALAADCAKDAGFYLAEACYTLPESPLFGCRIVNFVHDEFIFEVPEDPHRAHAAAMAANEIMEAAGRRWMPQVPPKSEPALMRRWYKGAEAVYEDGLLRPWEPR